MVLAGGEPSVTARPDLGAGRGGWWVAVGWLCGSALQLQQAAVADPRLWLLAGVCAASCCWLGTAVRVPRWRGLLCLLAATLLSWSVTDWRAQQRLADRLDPALEMQPVRVTGVVSGLPVWRPEGIRFELRVECAEPPSLAGIPARLSLSWHPSGDGASFSAATMPRAGQRWSLPVRLRLPDGPVNPHGFDVALGWFERGIGAVGTVQGRAGVGPAMLGETGGETVDRWRQGLRDRLRGRQGDTPAAGVLAALAVGDQAAIEARGTGPSSGRRALRTLSRSAACTSPCWAGWVACCSVGSGACAVHGCWCSRAGLRAGGCGGVLCAAWPGGACRRSARC